LYGERGYLRLSVTGDQFEVVAATGKHKRLLGATGSCTEEWETGPPYDQPVAVHRTFEGTVPK
jgi:hypothetical protein